MGNTFLKIDKQLNHLMETHVPAINNAEELSQLMHDAGILKYSSKKGVTHEQSILHSAKTINNHRNGLSVGTDWIKYYCEFFNCSADYLVGIIEYPTHEITDIVSEIGLDTESISRLQKMNKYRNFNRGLCKLIKSDAFGRFMMNWEQYLSSHDLANEYQEQFREQLIKWEVIKKKEVISDDDYLVYAYNCYKIAPSPLSDRAYDLIKARDEEEYTLFKLQQSIFSIETDSDSSNNKSTQ